ncbi:tetratricopeptide repeat protein [Benzoatithermus flavus]|uniref:Tetratricopeptide repeat protein n=1 Tax=Benzoatithermus flavus TaxID=3108223 RepID=A0ABU8XWM5_9PROT
MMGSAAPQLRLIESLLAERRTDEAERVLVRLAERHAEDAEAIAAVAALQASLGRLDEAARQARRALAVRGSLPARTLVALAETLTRAHRHEEADAALAAAIDAGDPDLELRLTRARLVERRGRTDLALRHWRRVLALAPDHREARLGMVRALRGEGRYVDAEVHARRLLEAAPKDQRAHAELARIALDAGDPVEAESRWHAALLAHPGSPDLVTGLAQALAAQHRFADACILLEELARAQPERGEPLAALVRTRLAEGDLDAAERRCRELLALEPERLPHRLLEGRILEQRSEHARAAELYARIAAEHPQMPEPALAAAELALRQGDLRTAEAGFRTVLALVPGEIAAELGLLATLAEQGLAAEVEAAAARALALAPNQPRAHLRRAQALETLGRLEAARLALLEARSAMPHREEPLLQLVRLTLRHGDIAAAATHAEALLAAHPRSLAARLTACDVALAQAVGERARAVLSELASELPEHREVQKRLARLDWLDGAIPRARRRWARITRFDARLHGPPDPIVRLDTHPLPMPAGEVRAFLLVRNEVARLPWLLEYYRKLGVDRFLFLDNDSDDGTREWLLAQGPDVHLFHTPASFATSGAGMRWINRLLDEHGSGAWCLTIDADEVLVYPHVERLSLERLTAYLDAIGAEAMVAPMLDMYADTPLDAVVYEPGQSLIEAFPWFDATGYVRCDSNDFPYFRRHGGCRARVFHETPNAGPVLQKVPLIRWAPDIKYTSSKHTAFPCRLADVSGALLHFKYLPDFAASVRTEVARGQHYLGGKEYRVYLRRLEAGESLSLMGPPSCRYRDSGQLVELGLIQTSSRFEAHVRDHGTR